MPKLTEKFQQFRRFVLALSGAHAETLDLLPSERARFESLGWAILITSGMATVSMWFALSSAMGLNGILALPAALLWGLVIMGIDRWLITSMPIDGSRKFAMAVPRLLLAILLGTLISTPLVLRIFQSEIDAQISVIKQDRYSAFLQQQQNSDVTKQVATLGAQLNYLNNVIATHGAATGNTSSDPRLVALTSQLNHWTALKTQYYNAYICQLYGGPACPRKGNGPAAQASHLSYLQAAAQVTTIQGEIQARDRQLASNSKTAQLARFQQAQIAQPTVQGEYNTAVARRNALQASFYAQNKGANGILLRLQALSQLSNGDFTVTAARFMLFLLFLVIECLPVTVKLLQRRGLYEEGLDYARDAERRDVAKYYSMRSRIGQGGRRMLQLRPEPETNVRSIWNRTRELPAGQIGVASSPDEESTDVIYGQDHWNPAAPAGYDQPEDGGAHRRWYGEDRWRNNWQARPEQDQVPDAPGQRQPQPPSWGAEDRRDSSMPPTRPDIPHRGSGPGRDGFPAERDSGDDYPDRPARDAAAPPARPAGDPLEFEDEPVTARSDGHGGGIPLSWEDE
jgi:hypothetical protein